MQTLSAVDSMRYRTGIADKPGLNLWTTWSMAIQIQVYRVFGLTLQ